MMLTKFCQRGQVNVQIITREKIQTVFRREKKMSLAKLASKMGGGELLGALSGNLLPSNKIQCRKSP